MVRAFYEYPEPLSSFPIPARHVYGSLIGFHRAYLALPEYKQSQLRVHMTLLDIHPTILARPGGRRQYTE